MSAEPGSVIDAPYEGVCANPSCGKAFRSAHPGKLTCSAKCKERVKTLRRQADRRAGRAAYQRAAVAEAAVVREIAPMAGLKVPAVLGERIRKRITRDEKVAAIEDLQARLLESIVEDDVIGEATLQQRVTSFAILEDKLGAIEAKPAPALRSEAREKVLGLLARLEERRRRQEGAVDVKATEVRK